MHTCAKTITNIIKHNIQISINDNHKKSNHPVQNPKLFATILII